TDTASAPSAIVITPSPFGSCHGSKQCAASNTHKLLTIEPLQLPTGVVTLTTPWVSGAEVPLTMAWTGTAAVVSPSNAAGSIVLTLIDFLLFAPGDLSRHPSFTGRESSVPRSLSRWRWSGRAPRMNWLIAVPGAPASPGLDRVCAPRQLLGALSVARPVPPQAIMRECAGKGEIERGSDRGSRTTGCYSEASSGRRY